MNTIGLNQEHAKKLSKELNLLLANYQIFYINLRGYHWNIVGKQFFTLHLKFEELYTDAFTKIDEIAERILTIGEKPIHSYTQYLELSEIKEDMNVFDAELAVKGVLNGLKNLIAKEREILKLSDEANDEGTNALMSDYIREQEKLAWMYEAYLK